MSDGGGYGLYAYSNDNDGIFGASPVGQGVEGETYGGSGAGVEGDSLSASFGDGVYGTSSDGDGVHGDISTTQGHAGVVGTNEGTGTGVYGASASGIGTTGIEYTAASPMPSADPSTYAGIYGQSQTGPGVYGVDEHNSGDPVLYGDATGIRPDFFSALYGYANDGPGIFTYSSNDFGAVITNGGSVAPTLVLNNNTAGGVGDLIDAASGAIKTDQPVFTVANDGSIFTNGNITYAGTETHQAVTRTAGSTVGTYSSQQSEATIEDVGSAQLAGGSASVAIAADFRDTIDGSRPYMVFLTPYGDNRGLYIASRSASGFVVKEAQGGHSSLAFDYRIVAHPYGTRLARLPHIRSARMANKNQYTVASRPAAFNGAAPDTMAASRANGAALRAADAVRRKAVLADRARHQFVHGAAPPLPANPFGLARAGANRPE